MYPTFFDDEDEDDDAMEGEEERRAMEGSLRGRGEVTNVTTREGVGSFKIEGRQVSRGGQESIH